MREGKSIQGPSAAAIQDSIAEYTFGFNRAHQRSTVGESEIRQRSPLGGLRPEQVVPTVGGTIAEYNLRLIRRQIDLSPVESSFRRKLIEQQQELRYQYVSPDGNEVLPRKERLEALATRTVNAALMTDATELGAVKDSKSVLILLDGAEPGTILMKDALVAEIQRRGYQPKVMRVVPEEELQALHRDPRFSEEDIHRIISENAAAELAANQEARTIIQLREHQPTRFFSADPTLLAERTKARGEARKLRGKRPWVMVTLPSHDEVQFDNKNNALIDPNATPETFLDYWDGFWNPVEDDPKEVERAHDRILETFENGRAVRLLTYDNERDLVDHPEQTTDITIVTLKRNGQDKYVPLRWFSQAGGEKNTYNIPPREIFIRPSDDADVPQEEFGGESMFGHVYYGRPVMVGGLPVPPGFGFDVRYGQMVKINFPEGDSEYAQKIRTHLQTIFQPENNTLRFGELGVGTDLDQETSHSSIARDEKADVHLAAGNGFQTMIDERGLITDLAGQQTDASNYHEDMTIRARYKEMWVKVQKPNGGTEWTLINRDGVWVRKREDGLYEPDPDCYVISNKKRALTMHPFAIEYPQERERKSFDTKDLPYPLVLQ